MGDFELFCERNQGGMYRIAVQVLHDSQQAEDATQEAFVRIFQGMDRLEFDTERAEKVYALRAASNSAIDMLRQRKLSDNIDDVELSLTSHEGNPYQSVSAAESIEEINSLLSAKAKAIFCYRSMGLLDVEIAATLDISISNVRTIVYRARLQVTGSLGREEDAQHG